MVCTSGAVDKLPVIIFVSINIVSTLGQYGVYLRYCLYILSVVVFVPINIVSTHGQ